MTLYARSWNPDTPGYIIFLVDQSASMKEKYAGNESRAVFTAKAINRTIYNLIMANAYDDKVDDRVFISLIGYGGRGENSVEDIKSEYLSKFADEPVRLEKVIKRVSDGSGGFVDVLHEFPVFLEPVANGLTPMARAFELAEQLIRSWVQIKADSPPPIVLNISDGIPYNGNQKHPNEELDHTIIVVNNIMNISTYDGAPLVFNAHISVEHNEITFPESESELMNDEMARLLFQISSKIPDSFKAIASMVGLKVKENSKGFITNADPESLVKFITFGSIGGVRK